MGTLLLILIYITFISLGLPDSLLGSSWSVMRHDIGTDLAAAGIISMTINGGTVVSSFFSDRLVRWLNTGIITIISVAATAGALLGFALAPSFGWLVAMAVPLGLGAGAVDAVLNNYVAIHYKPRHMSWLHCFWGIGAMCGPLIMSWFIQQDSNWRGGYLTVSIIQCCLVASLFVCLFILYKQKKSGMLSDPNITKFITQSSADFSNKHQINSSSNQSVLKISGVPPALLACFFYCGIELTASVWGSSFLVESKGLSAAQAAGWISILYAGLTVGRFVSGLVSMKLSSSLLIRIGQMLIFIGGITLALPLPTIFFLIGLILIGAGCAPVYPCILHETPHRFGIENSQKVMGIQMACAYTGSTLLPPVLGYIAAAGAGMNIYPIVLLIYNFGMMLCCERLNYLSKKYN